MADVITLQDLARDALELSGRGGTSSDAQTTRAVNRAIRWVWLRLSDGYDGFAWLMTEILTPASGDRFSIAAGQGGADTTDGTPTAPIVRGVHRIRGLYRPTAAGGPDRYPASWVSSTTYYDNAAPRLDDRSGAPPGVYWTELPDNGSSDVVVLRPPLSGIERIRLVYTPTAPVLASPTDTLARMDNADDAIVHMAGYYLLLAQDYQRAKLLHAEAVRIVQEAILAYHGARPSGGVRHVGAFARRQGAPGAW